MKIFKALIVCLLLGVSQTSYADVSPCDVNGGLNGNGGFNGGGDLCVVNGGDIANGGVIEVPEPSTVVIFGLGLVGLVLSRKKK